MSPSSYSLSPIELMVQFTRVPQSVFVILIWISIGEKDGLVCLFELKKRGHELMRVSCVGVRNVVHEQTGPHAMLLNLKRTRHSLRLTPCLMGFSPVTGRVQ